MKPYRNKLTWLLVIATGAVLAGHAGAGEIGVSCRRQEMGCPGRGPGAIHLPDRMVIAASDSLFVGDSLLVRDRDYRMDYAEGTVYLHGSLPDSTCVVVKYSVFPFMLKPAYALRTVKETRAGPSSIVRAEPFRAEREKSYDLRASGSKTVRLEAGTLSDVRINQALSLSIGGTIGDGVEVRGVLSDRDMSFGQQASTARLKDLDRVFMEVSSDNAYARVGDLEIDEAPGELLRFRRNMTGFFADGTHGSKNLSMSGATTKSTYERIEIRGTEGIAGPYAVAGTTGEIVDIVRNSETVWLDGERMERGSGADYTIDYATGEIHFNPRHLIREDARIVVDYEMVDHNRQRQFYYGRSSLGLGKRATLAVTFANEASSVEGGDAAASDASGTISLGSSEGWVDGGRFVGYGQGSYMRIERDTLTYYEYVGEGLGEYDVTFTRVGEGEGTYSYIFSDTWDTYVHVFTSSGSYVAGVRETPSVSARVTHIGASADITDGIKLATEFAQSKGHVEDAEGNWQSRQDMAYLVVLSGQSDLPSVAGRNAGRVDFTARRRSVGSNYIGFDRPQRPDFMETWAQKPVDDAGIISEAGLDYTVGKIATSFDVGALETDLGRSERRAASLNIGDEKLGVTASAEATDMNSTSASRGIERNGLGIRIPFEFVHLSAGRDFEVRSRLTDSTSLRREEYYSQVRLSGKGGAIGFRLSRDLEDRDTGMGWAEYASRLEGRATFQASTGRRFSARCELAQRRLDYAENQGMNDQHMTSGDLHIDVRDVLAINSLAVDYRLANTLTSLYEADFVKVDGVGDYDSLGNYVPGAGTHVLSRREKGKEPVTRVKANFSLELGGKGKIVPDRSLSSRTGFDIEGESVNGRLERVAIPHPGYLLDDPETRFARVDLTEELVFRRSSGYTVTLNARGSRSIDSRCAGRKEERSSGELRARLLSTALRATSVTLEGRLAAERSSIEMQAGVSQPERDTWSGRVNVQRSFMSGVRGRVRFELTDESRRTPAARFVQADVAPGITVLAGAVRWDAGCSIKRMMRSEYSSASIVPRRDSFDWNSRFSLRHGTHTSLSVEYTGRKMKDVRTIHNLRASLSAAF
jgi:hypothetical protein